MNATLSGKKRKQRPGKQVQVKVGNVVVRIYCRRRRKGKAVYDQFDVADHSSGQRKFISFSDLEAARRKAKDIGAKLGTFEAATLSLSGSDRAAYVRAVDLLKELGTPLELAVAEYVAARKLMRGGSILDACRYWATHKLQDIPDISVGKAVEELLAAKKDEGRSKRYIQDLESRLGAFKKSFQCSLAGATGEAIRAWIQGLDVGNRSRNNYRLAIQTLFSFARRRKYVVPDCNELAGVPLWTEPDNVVEVYTPTELRTLLAVTPDNVRPFVVIGAFCGLRSAEIERLDWSKVNLVEGHITVDASIAKTNSRRIVPIPDNARAWLTPLAKKTGRVCELSNTNNALQRIARATRPAIGEPPAVPWKHNALRHSFCSYRLALTKNIAQVSLEAGNSPAMIRQHYLELVTEAVAKEWFAILPAVQPANVIALREAAHA